MSDTDYLELVKNIRPAIIAVTQGDPILAKKQKQAKAVRAKVVEIANIKVPSTSKIAKLLKLE
jgi:hypothetical protein